MLAIREFVIHMRSTVMYPLHWRVERMLIPEIEALWRRASIIIETYCAVQAKTSAETVPATAGGRRGKASKLELQRPRKIARSNSAPAVAKSVQPRCETSNYKNNVLLIWRQELEETIVSLLSDLIKLNMEIEACDTLVSVVANEASHPYVVEWNQFAMKFGDPSITSRVVEEGRSESKELLPLKSLDLFCRLSKIEAYRLFQALRLVECSRDSFLKRGFKFFVYRGRLASWSRRLSALTASLTKGGAKGLEECLLAPPGRLWQTAFSRPKEPDLLCQQLMGQLLHGAVALGCQQPRPISGEIPEAEATLPPVSDSQIDVLLEVKRHLDTFLAHQQTLRGGAASRSMGADDAQVLGLGGPAEDQGKVGSCGNKEEEEEKEKPETNSTTITAGIFSVGTEASTESSSAEQQRIWQSTAQSDNYRSVFELPVFDLLTNEIGLPALLESRLLPKQPSDEETEKGRIGKLESPCPCEFTPPNPEQRRLPEQEEEGFNVKTSSTARADLLQDVLKSALADELKNAVGRSK